MQFILRIRLLIIYFKILPFITAIQNPPESTLKPRILKAPIQSRSQRREMAQPNDSTTCAGSGRTQQSSLPNAHRVNKSRIAGEN
uniref:Uncharacterized protein n=1 Tax=Arundo donax TaxID=35708 RepID=A0A0A8YV40_ARUDO